jgi:chromosome partitioning protein
LIGSSQVSSNVLHNPRLKLSLLPASPSLAGAEVELVGELARESFLKKALSQAIDRYDYILIDCPPSLGLLTLNGLIAAQDGVIIPVQCEFLPLEGLGQLTDTLDRVRDALFAELRIRGVLLTMFDSRTNLSADVVKEVRRHFPGLVFNSVVPRSVRLAEAPSYGQPISIYAPNSTGARAYENLAREVLVEDGVPIPVFQS